MNYIREYWMNKTTYYVASEIGLFYKQYDGQFYFWDKFYKTWIRAYDRPDKVSKIDDPLLYIAHIWWGEMLHDSLRTLRFSVINARMYETILSEESLGEIYD